MVCWRTFFLVTLTSIACAAHSERASAAYIRPSVAVSDVMPSYTRAFTRILLLWSVTGVCASTDAASSASTHAPHLRRALAMDPVDVGVLFGTPEGKRSLQQLETAPTIAACGALVLGAALCAVGARFEKHAALGCAFLDGAVLVSLALAELHVLPDEGDWASAASWACFFLGGALLGVVTLANDALGRFVVGGTAGMLFAFACQTTFGARLAANHPWVPLVAMATVFGVVCGLLTTKLARPAVVVATSWIGANAMVWGAAYFVGNYPNSAAGRREDHQRAIPGEWWGYLASTVACCVLGCVAQHCALVAEKPPAPVAHRSGTYERLETPRMSSSTG